MKNENEIKIMRADAYNNYLEADRLFRAEVQKGSDPDEGQRQARLRGLASERIATLDEVLGIESEFTRLIKLRNQ